MKEFYNRIPSWRGTGLFIVMFFIMPMAQWIAEDTVPTPSKDSLSAGELAKKNRAADSAKKSQSKGDSILQELKKIAGTRAPSVKKDDTAKKAAAPADTLKVAKKDSAQTGSKIGVSVSTSVQKVDTAHKVSAAADTLKTAKKDSVQTASKGPSAAVQKADTTHKAAASADTVRVAKKDSIAPVLINPSSMEKKADSTPVVPAPIDLVTSPLKLDSSQTVNKTPVSVSKDIVAANKKNIYEPVKPAEVKPALENKFSIFSMSKMLELGVSCEYFYYNEYIDLDEYGRSFQYKNGRPPKIIGKPKSAEYGGVFGFNVNSWFFPHGSPLFIRPKFSFLVGLGNAYDGSSQAQPFADSLTGDTIGIRYLPHADSKNNYFLAIGSDIGVGFPKAGCPFGVYTGIDARFWYRDMMLNTDKTDQTSGITNAETYYWFSVPLGLFFTKPVSVKTVVGFDARIDLMFFGTMNYLLSQASSGQSVNYPAVTLGNRASYTLELFSQFKTNDVIAWKISPYVKVYGFGKSESETATTSFDNTRFSFFEPSSATLLAGCAINVLIMSAATHSHQ